MKKMNLALVGLVAGSLLVGSATTFAAAGESVGSNGTITFTENNKPTPPKDPNDPGTNPTDPEKPVKPEVTEQNGPLSLDVIPSFDFGSHAVDLAGGTYADTKTEDKYNTLQVTDNRDDANGWSVTAHRTEFVTSGATTVKLDGVTLSLPAGAARNAISNTQQGNATTAAAIKNGTVKSVAGEIKVGAGEAVTVFGAQNLANVGKSTSTALLTEKADGSAKGQTATLKVPAGAAKKGEFNSTITWTMQAAPLS